MPDALKSMVADPRQINFLACASVDTGVEEPNNDDIAASVTLFTGEEFHTDWGAMQFDARQTHSESETWRKATKKLKKEKWDEHIKLFNSDQVTLVRVDGF